MFEEPFPRAFAPIAMTFEAAAAAEPALNPSYTEFETLDMLLPAA
jgi:hypothetical protein